MLHEVNKKILKDLIKLYITIKGLPKWYSSKEFLCQCKRNERCGSIPGSIPGSGRCPGEGNRNPLQYPFPENFKDRGAWQATAHGLRKSRT